MKLIETFEKIFYLPLAVAASLLGVDTAAFTRWFHAHRTAVECVMTVVWVMVLFALLLWKF